MSMSKAYAGILVGVCGCVASAGVCVIVLLSASLEEEGAFQRGRAQGLKECQAALTNMEKAAKWLAK